VDQDIKDIKSTLEDPELEHEKEMSDRNIVLETASV